MTCPGSERAAHCSSYTCAAMMTKLLERAVKKVAALPAREQHAFARLMIEELAAESRWERSFRRSRGELCRMAEAALAEHRAGRTRRLDLARL